MDNILKSTIRIKEQSPEDVFFEIDHKEKLDLLENNKLNIFCLNIVNYKFSYKELFNLLKDNLGTYVLSRKEYRKNPERAISKAIDKLKKVQPNSKDFGAGGELGELILYIFLEHYLHAPKILSKVELKTTQNQYVYNADGVHFYHFSKDDYSYYQLVIGESKIKNKYNEAINAAFESIITSKLNDSNEINLISSEIFKEVFSMEEVEQIEDMIIPKATSDFNNNVIKNKAFGIFIGFDFTIDKTIPLPKQREKVKEDLCNLAKLITESINQNIKKYNLFGYSFYIYFLPFNDCLKDKAEIMRQLLIQDAFKEV